MASYTPVTNFAQTQRLRIAYYRAGVHNPHKLMLIHGNLSSAVFFLPLFQHLSQRFDVVAPDLRAFGDTDPLPIDATRGYRDWSGDVRALARYLGWKSFNLAGWSMGGGVVMQYAIDHSETLEKLILIAPCSPFGFGGTRDEKGTPLEPIGLASGGGTAHASPQLMMALTMQSEPMMREIINTGFFKPPFRLPPQWEDLLVEGTLKTKLGKGLFPGDSLYASKWPYIAAGDIGVLNTMSPRYGNLSRLANIWKKPPILWIRGRDDEIVSDYSMREFGALGKEGIIPGWPGDDEIPPQPMLAQTRYLLNQYQERGGTYREEVISGGHMCCLEAQEEFFSVLEPFLLEEETA